MGEADRRNARGRRGRLLLPQARGRGARRRLRAGARTIGGLAVGVLLTAHGIASAKGDVVRIGISGGGLPREIMVPGSNADVAYQGSGPPTLPDGERFYLVRFYVR